jgi:Protein of unknown function (DUF3435)
MRKMHLTYFLYPWVNLSRITLAFREKPILLRDPIPWFLALAFADCAFRDYPTPAKLFDQRVPERWKTMPLYWKPEVEELPVFRVDRNSRVAMNSDHYRKIWRRVCADAGYYENTTHIHSIRRAVANVAGSEWSFHLLIIRKLIICRTLHASAEHSLPGPNSVCFYLQLSFECFRCGCSKCIFRRRT